VYSQCFSGTFSMGT